MITYLTKVDTYGAPSVQKLLIIIIPRFGWQNTPLALILPKWQSCDKLERLIIHSLSAPMVIITIHALTGQDISRQGLILILSGLLLL